MFIQFHFDANHDGSTKIWKGYEKSGAIEIGKEVKQGCLLYPFVFAITIDAASQKVVRMSNKDVYWRFIWTKNVFKIIQAYADDIVIFSESKQGL
jgi:hypothetical protein